MALEIERKYRVTGDAWRAAAEHSEDLVQGYLNLEGGAITRVRIAGDRAWLNLKGATLDIVRHEFEYPIPLNDAREMLAKLCIGPPVEKRRHHVRHAGRLWEVDEFSGANAGLVVAEIELGSATPSGWWWSCSRSSGDGCGRTPTPAPIMGTATS